MEIWYLLYILYDMIWSPGLLLLLLLMHQLFSTKHKIHFSNLLCFHPVFKEHFERM